MSRERDIQAIRNFITELSKAMDEKISSAPYDQSTVGKVLEQFDDNKYSVIFDGKVMTVKANINAAFNVGDYVKIKIPKNSLKDAYIEPKTGNSRDPNDAKYLHEHKNKEILDELTLKNLKELNSLKALAFKDNISIEDLESALSLKIAKIDTLENSISNKVDKISGMGLSTNDFSNSYKSTVDALAAGGGNVQSDFSVTDASSPAYIKNKPNIPASSADLVDGAFLIKTNKVYVLNGGNAASYTS